MPYLESKQKIKQSVSTELCLGFVAKLALASLFLAKGKISTFFSVRTIVIKLVILLPPYKSFSADLHYWRFNIRRSVFPKPSVSL